MWLRCFFNVAVVLPDLTECFRNNKYSVRPQGPFPKTLPLMPKLMLLLMEDNKFT